MGYRINVKNAKYALVSSNTSTYTIGSVTALPGLRNIDLALLSSSGELYGDGALVSKLSKLTGATLKFGIDKISLADRAALLGAAVGSDGILDLKTTDTPADVAFYFETELDNGKKEQLWLLVGKAEPFGFSAQQAEGNINYSTDEITINFVRREKDNKVLRFGDSEMSGFTTTISSQFAAHPDLTT